MGKEIIVTISDDGEIAVETTGFKGKSCLKESAFIENVLGAELHRQLTPAYFETDPDENRKKFLNLCG